MRFRCLYTLLLIALMLPATPALSQSSTASGISRAFNPAISVNTLLLGRLADKTTERAYNGADLQEAEVQLTAMVDPYWKANLVLAVHPEHAHDDEEGGHGGYAGDVEVATIDGQAVPGGFGLLVGKDYLPFGKHVPLHTHQYAFVDAPAAVVTFLGDHGLTEVGVRLAHDLPLPWYSDLTAYAVDGKSTIFAGESRDPVWGARWSNLFDLSMESTLEIGGSWLHGPMAHDYLLIHHDEDLSGKLDVWGADVTFKWVSASASKGPALTLTGELILPRPEAGAQDPWGWYALGQYRFLRNWWFGLATGALDRGLDAHEQAEPGDDHHGLFLWEKVREYKANLTWVPSEFSAVRLEVARYVDQVGDADETLASLQVNFTIGSHPAHLY